MFTWGKLESAGEAKQLAALLVDDAHLVVAAVGVELHSEVGEHNLGLFLENAAVGMMKEEMSRMKEKKMRPIFYQDVEKE